MAPSGSPDRLVVGVDFGTTFSGVAYSYSATPDRPDEIQVIKTWPGANGITSDKVPTELAYQASHKKRRLNGRSSGSSSATNPGSASFGETIRWGLELKPDEQRLQCIKLFLDPSHSIPNYISSMEMEEQLESSGKTAAIAASDYLTKLFRHAKETLIRRYGAYFIETTTIEVVLTVPAIWSDAAKKATEDAARNAGMGESIRMISEPEAAAVYTLQAIQPNSLKKGDNFVVCDAGGGTVDLISYEIKQVNPLRVEESVRGTGACCGAAFLNVRFEEYVRSKMGAIAFRAICTNRPRTWLTATKYFEEHVKRNFNPDDDTEFNIPFPGVDDNPAAGIEQGYLTMPAAAVGKLFKPITDQIIGLVEGQIELLRDQDRRVSGIVLVGGFGQSNCLYQSLVAHFAHLAQPPPHRRSRTALKNPGQHFEIMQPNNAWTAVVRGAVLRGLEDKEVVLSRRSRRHYGVLMMVDYMPMMHNRAEAVWNDLEEKWIVDNKVKWYLEKGQTSESGKPVNFPFYNTFSRGQGKTATAHLVVCDDDIPPVTYDPSDAGPIRKLCRLPANLGRVPDRLRQRKTNSNGRDYEELHYVIAMELGSGGLKFELRVDDVAYGEVVAEF